MGSDDWTHPGLGRAREDDCGARVGAETRGVGPVLGTGVEVRFGHRDPVQQGVGVREQSLPRLCEADSAGASREERRPDLALERRDLL